MFILEIIIPGKTVFILRKGPGSIGLLPDEIAYYRHVSQIPPGLHM